MGRNLKMPWSIEDTVENVDRIRDMMIKSVRQVNLDGNGEEDVREINYDFDRVKKALRKQIPTKVNLKKCDNCETENCGGCEDYYDRCPDCGEGLGRDSGEIFKYCPECGQALDWVN